MISDIRRLLGNMTISEAGGIVTINGIPSKTMATDIKRIWGTSRINSWMFTRITRSSVSLPSFFALDFLYAINQLEKEPMRRTNVRALRRMRELLLSETWLAKTQQTQPSRLNYRKLKDLNVTLMDHQQRFLENYDLRTNQLSLGGYILAGAPGSGKTITGLALSLCLEADVTVVVCPKNAVYDVWEKTLLTRLRRGPGKVWIADRETQMDYTANYYIFHYESLGRAVELSKKIKTRTPVVILDESHNLNLTTKLSQRTKHYIELCKNLKTVNALWASGTPLKALGGEMVPFLGVVDSLFTQDVEERFIKIFGKNSQRANDILSHRLGMMTFKVEKSEYSARKPIYENIYVKIPNGQDYTLDAIKLKMQQFITERRAYYQEHRQQHIKTFEDLLLVYSNTLPKRGVEQQEFDQYIDNINVISQGYDRYTMQEIATWCKQYEDKKIIPKLNPNQRKVFRDVRSAVKYPELKVQGECLGRVVGGMRKDCHRAMVTNLDLSEYIDTAAKKTLMFSSYIDVVDDMVVALDQQGYMPLAVHSRTSTTLLSQLKEFQTNLDANPLVTTFDSLSTAVPLTEANVVVMLNAPFRDYIYDQAVSRADRLDQDEQVYVYNVYLDTGTTDNISTRSKDILAWSKEQVESLMGFKVEDDALLGLESLEDNPTEIWKGMVKQPSLTW